MDFERRTLTWLALHLDPPTVVLDDSITDGQAQAQSPLLLCREEWLENLRQIPLLDPETSVRHRNRNRRRAAVGRGLCLCRYGQLTALWHRVDRVQTEIHQYLLHLLRVGRDAGQVVLYFRNRLDLLFVQMIG